jgi:hypothetical protein
MNKAAPTLEGAGVHLHRAFGFGKTGDFDPFLLFDDFRNDREKDYRAGFPWHPHRGIETITYVLAGTVEHGDSLGNSGVLGPGDIQWMTAGSGIVHQEMPKGDAEGRMHGFQLWANLPARFKMCDPRYQDIKAGAIPEVTEDDGVKVRVICGSYGGETGPVEGVAADPRYLDVAVPPDTTWTLGDPSDHASFAYVFEGAGTFCNESRPLEVPADTAGWWDTEIPDRAENRHLVLFGKGDEISLSAGPRGIRFLFVSGRPLEEPVAWYGPIVMNTQEELQTAFREYQDGTFLKHQK